ncbi:MAG: histidine kinase [Lachnospiraceae bacterium]|nr:histidine kinase [Lachnospiraceae bacterium]
MKTRLKNLSLRFKMTGISLLVNLIVFAINLALLFGINRMSGQIESVYQANLQLNELSASLKSVQDNMTEYLNAKTSDALENYYLSAQEYSDLVDMLPSDIKASSMSRMGHSIKAMSESYLDEVEQTIDGKRGRNVEKYRNHYEEATKFYGYLNTEINSVNNEQFKENRMTYREMLNAFRFFETFGNIVMIVVIIINAFLIMSLTTELIRPLTSLTGMANEVSAGNFNISPLEVKDEDEIGVVTKAFNEMVVSIQDYIEKIRENAEAEKAHKEKELLMESHLKDAQLKYLQAQINPHFLFNTLNAGAQLAMLESADRTYEYIQVMAEFFRYNVKKGFNTVTIGEEIELVDNYIYILNVRFSGDIHYEKEIDSTLLDVEMPSMILQPIVENCVNHGIREMMGEGRITLKVYALDNTACISIEDNGIGMDRDTIDHLMSGTPMTNEKKDSNGIGMDNVLARLKLFEGTDDVIGIESEGPGKGSKFTIYLDKERSNTV